MSNALSLRIRKLLILQMWALVPFSAIAQPTHLEQLKQVGVLCLQGTLINVGDFELDADAQSPFIRSALVESWMSRGHRVFLNEQSPADREGSDSLLANTVERGARNALPRFQYRIEDLGISLREAGSGRVERTARIGMRYLLKGPDAQVLSDNTCSRSQVDLVELEVVNSLADTRYPQTNVRFQHVGWLQKNLHPIMIVGAAVIGTYLFFNLRSKRSTDG